MAPHTMPQYEQRGPQWLYTLMKKMWSNWLPTPSLRDVHNFIDGVIKCVSAEPVTLCILSQDSN
ncbi:Sphingomyelin phosphodiesterase 2 [Parelaphostrongylus tenuis]|uniref:Sphingomyelin phosphodiesterase 2 n=1 Tax=Parelaphostrongylus tenuis TaxID=148309 RepID=A0AAD5QX92_PARTN|nr:Sphingomyelin phosphodiesterase 2 [Parelaphostrongylus tenuis]